METIAPYALVVIDPGASSDSATLCAIFHERLGELGVPAEAVDVLDPASFDPKDPTQTNRAVVAVYFGSDARDDAATSCAARFVAEHWPILPVVPTTSEFLRWVPEPLFVVNGMERDLDHAANVLLADLGLVRRRRRLFISYLRRESTGVARQLAAALLEHGYEVFLDTTSVCKGALFQAALWEAMTDTDIVLFLDTPEAMTSQWVAQEYARASDLGVSLLHLVWPGHRRANESAFAEAIFLTDADFADERAKAGHLATLSPFCVEQIARTLERLRARSWRHRRARLVEGFVRQTQAVHAVTAIDPTSGVIRFTARAGAASVAVRPIHGVPQSFDWHDAHLANDAPRLLYQRSGVGRRMSEHIAWLDRHLPTQSLALEEVETWLSS